MIFSGFTTSSCQIPKPVAQLYEGFELLHREIGGHQNLRDVTGQLDWPERGVYFFFSPGTDFDESPAGQWHLTRVGTVGVAQGSSNTLWNRLRQHRGNFNGKYAGGGNHRGSIFRLHVGRAIIEQEDLHEKYPYWGKPLRDIDVETTTVRTEEHPLEQRVSEYIRDLPFLWINVPDKPGPDSDRAEIEKHVIAMLSHFRRTNPELYLDGWLGHQSPKPEIYKTGLWNIDHIGGFYSQHVVELIKKYAHRTDSIEE